MFPAREQGRYLFAGSEMQDSQSRRESETPREHIWFSRWLWQEVFGLDCLIKQNILIKLKSIHKKKKRLYMLR